MDVNEVNVMERRRASVFLCFHTETTAFVSCLCCKKHMQVNAWLQQRHAASETINIRKMWVLSFLFLSFTLSFFFFFFTPLCSFFFFHMAESG